ncbi:MAG: acyl-CoA dehydrogenase [Cellvibrionaceae bacterium]
MSTVINRRDLDFLLYEFLNVEEVCERDLYADHDRASFDAVLDLAQQIAEEKFAPIAAKLDENEPEFDGEKVHILPEVKEAHNAYIEAGFMSASCTYEDGGMQLPLTIAQAARAIFCSANIPALGYLGLTNSAANMLQTWGSEELKKKFLPPMRNGRFYGTMCLSEPHAGSNLADIRTRAEPQEDGTYRLYGTKMWISGGEHDLSENIIHMVLAKTPGGPAGVKGISLFLVPKYRLDENGKAGERNGVALVGLNHKMGYRGTTNTLLNFGEKEPCVGYLMGAEHEGLKCMFHMMNEARIGVGMGAVMLGYAGYLHSLAYAKERPQGRLPGEKDPSAPQVNIIEHADVKRMLLQQKAYVEGGLSLTLYCGKLVDDAKTGDAALKKDLAIFMDLLTPIVKAWPSDFCLKANELAIQVLGGAGYTRDYPVERLYRDNRLNPIHEGTNGIQGMDLLGRKVRINDGYGYQLLVRYVEETVAQANKVDSLKEYAKALQQALNALTATTDHLKSVAATQIRLATANATIYLNAFGHIVVAWLWLKQGLAAERGLAGAVGDDVDFYQGKMSACRYFYRYELPSIHTDLALLDQLDDTCLTMSVASF